MIQPFFHPKESLFPPLLLQLPPKQICSQTSQPDAPGHLASPSYFVFLHLTFFSAYI